MAWDYFAALPRFSSANHDHKEGRERREKAGLYGQVVTDCLVFFSMGRSFPGQVCFLLKGVIFALYYQHQFHFFLSRLPSEAIITKYSGWCI